MSPSPQFGQYLSISFPRVSGDEPRRSGPSARENAFSPRERG